MTFAEMQSDVFDRIGQLQSPDAAVVRRIKAWLNRWNRKILTSPGMESLRRVLLTQASVVDQQTYGLAVQSIRFMTESTSQRRLREQTLGWYRESYPAPANFSGTPLFYVPMGFARIHTRPTAAAELFVKSTAAGDTNTAYVDVIRSDGYKRTLSKVMTGVTAVSFDTAITDAIDVLDFYVSAAAVGTITLHMTSGAGTELARIPIGATYQRFFRYALVPTPSAVITYTIDGIAQLSDMTIATDEPFPYPDFHDILVDGAVHDEWKSKGRSADARDLRIEIEKRIRDLRGAILEWPESPVYRERSFEETIQLPVT
jgi:hypothetical protein